MLGSNKVSLSEICDLIPGFAFKSQDFTNTCDKVIKIADIQPPYVFHKDLKSVNISGYKKEKLAKFIAKSGDLVLAMTGATIGKLGRLQRGHAYVNQRVLLLKPKENIDKDYFYYSLLGVNFQKFILNHIDSQTAQPNISATTIGKYTIPIPSLEEQKRIGKILRSLDRKIELNLEINDNLSKLMSLLFQIKVIKNPDIEKWNKLPLTDIANYKNGLAMQRYRPKEGEPGIPVLKIKELGQGTCSIDSEHCSENIDKTVIVYDGDVIFSWSGTLLVKVWTGGKAGLNQHLFKVTSETYPKWFYFLWTLHHLENFVAIAAAKATTMGHIKRKDLELSEVFVPPKEEFDHLNKVFSPLLNKIIAIGIENRKLIEIRDLLLKKLMGELEANR